MPNLIQIAATGRARCRGCGRAIAARELRFGESLPSTYGEGETLHWFHLACAACMRPDPFLPALDCHSESVPDREWLRDAALLGHELPQLARLARAERASSGRARCRSCQELIAAGSWRLALQDWEEGRFNAAGFVHAECCEAYFGTAQVLDRIVRLTPELDAAAEAELARVLENQRSAPAGDLAGPAPA